MNNVDLPGMIRECVDGGTRPVTATEAREREVVRSGRASVRRVPVRIAVAAAGVAAAGAVGGLVASQVGGGTATGTVVTAAMVEQVASASQAAMTSGEADIHWTSNGSPSVVQDITFDGANWNDLSNPGQPFRVRHVVMKWRGRTVHAISWTGEMIIRVVDGQMYRYPAFTLTATGFKIDGWERDDPPGAAYSYDIPDPKTLLSVLSPSAGFVTDGTSTVNGVTASHLRATTPGAVPIKPLNNIIQSEPDNAKVSAIDLWVSSSDVVQKITVTVTGTNGSGAPSSVTVTATFSHIGQVQPITPPSSYITVGGKG